jgi:uncharacterized protein YecT (DUF1311 family)
MTAARTALVIAAIATILIYSGMIAPLRAESNPCHNEDFGNAQVRECYSKENVRIDVEVETLASKIASRFIKDAREEDDVIGGCLRRAASEVTQSQRSWKKYREQHCTAIFEAYTTGSGAETGYEACKFRLGQERLKELRAAFFPGKAK